MKNLPVAEDSLLLRTRVWREFLPGTRKAQGPQHYTYIYQRMNNFNDWLADRRVTNVHKIIKRPRINDRPIFFESRPK